jgi:hypothetical protein
MAAGGKGAGVAGRRTGTDGVTDVDIVEVVGVVGGVDDDEGVCNFSFQASTAILATLLSFNFSKASIARVDSSIAIATSRVRRWE